MKRVAILGATGSIGRSALGVVDAHGDRVRVVALGAGQNAELLAEQVRKYRPSVVAVAHDAARHELIDRLGGAADGVSIFAGDEGRLAVATHPEADILLCASSGTTSLDAALAAIDARKTLALANKEVLVMAGALMVEAAAKRGVAILPVDSEHNAIHQCLHGRAKDEVRRLVLTASGGPFRMLDDAALAHVTPADALRHPTWQMGRKITIDSATLMNKGLEVIEARWLFGDVISSGAQIDVVVHPQSIVHSMVALRDGSVIAQLSVTDMKLPIQYAFSYPERWESVLAPLDVVHMGTLEFQPPDRRRFRCLQLAYDALAHGGAWPAVLNAANEIAVEGFLAGAVRFADIPVVIENALSAADAHTSHPRSLSDVHAADAWARVHASETVRTLPSS